MQALGLSKPTHLADEALVQRPQKRGPIGFFADDAYGSLADFGLVVLVREDRSGDASRSRVALSRADTPGPLERALANGRRQRLVLRHGRERSGYPHAVR